ncbi:MAG TPA: hypothetical protein HA276_07385, partial [Candidatus Poseidoniaceae archaeon]
MGRPATAVALVLTMMLAGCLGMSGDVVEPQELDSDEQPVIETPWNLKLSESVRNPVAGDLLIFEVSGGAAEHADAILVGDVRMSIGAGIPTVVSDVAVSTNGAVVVAVEAPSTGVTTVSVDLHPAEGVTFADGSLTLQTQVSVRQAGVRLVLPVAVAAEDGQISFDGSIAPLRDRPESDMSELVCSATMNLGDEAGDVLVSMDEQRGFSVILDEEGLLPLLVVSATCVGPVDTVTVEKSVRLILSEVVVDADGDDIHDDVDRCPNGVGDAQSWRSTPSTDHDADGCRDRDEDNDDDDD